MSKMTLNPAWKRHNDYYNEGGEGYNPHSKWIAAPVAAPAVEVKSPSGKVYRDSRGMPIDPAALLAESEARLATLSDPIAIKLVQGTIAKYRAMLEA